MAKPTFNRALIKQAVVAAQANARQATSHVKTRGEVSGGGRKPWRQKGTGRARAGSSRSPIWVGGGIVFGPSKERHYKQRFPKKMSQAALGQLLQYMLGNKQIIIEEALVFNEVKTKQVIELLKKLGVLGKKTLFVTNEINPELILSARNIPGITVVENRNLSILAMSSSEILVFDKQSAQGRGLISVVKTPVKSASKKTTKK